MRSFHYFCNFLIQKIFPFFVSLWKRLSEFLPAPLTWETISALRNLREVFGCFILTDFMSTMFGFSVGFGS